MNDLLREKILRNLESNSRIDLHELSIMLGVSEAEVANEVSSMEKERILNRILMDNESILSVSIDEGLVAKGMLNNWLKKYRENGYNIVERKRGCLTMTKNDKKTLEAENKKLKQENEYLKAQLEYSKKLRAVVQSRKNRQQKKK